MKPKKPLITIIEHSEKFKSKPQQIQSSQEGVHQVSDLRPFAIAKRASDGIIMPRTEKVKDAKERLKEKENQGD